jgi:hypothetical protein
MLRKRLSVPNIYIEPPSSLIAADVLAVDRAGAGDLHAIVIQSSIIGAILNAREWILTQVKATLQKLTPVHYRYLAVPQSVPDLVLRELGPHLYSPDGIGRIGIITIIDRGEDPPTAELSIAPERFRVDAAKLRNIERKLLEKVRPDIEVRI